MRAGGNSSGQWRSTPRTRVDTLARVPASVFAGRSARFSYRPAPRPRSAGRRSPRRSGARSRWTAPTGRLPAARSPPGSCRTAGRPPPECSFAAVRARTDSSTNAYSSLALEYSFRNSGSAMKRFFRSPNSVMMSPVSCDAVSTVQPMSAISVSYNLSVVRVPERSRRTGGSHYGDRRSRERLQTIRNLAARCGASPDAHGHSGAPSRHRRPEECRFRAIATGNRGRASPAATRHEGAAAPSDSNFHFCL